MAQPEQHREFELSSKRRKSRPTHCRPLRIECIDRHCGEPVQKRPMNRQPHSIKLSKAEEARIVEFRRRTLLALDDMLGHLRESLPQLSRSALHRCLRRHGISRRPCGNERNSKRGRFDPKEIGYLHIDML